MSWSYSPGGTDPLDQVRFIIGDTVTTDQQLQDEEITVAIGMRSNVYAAAAICCRSLASKFSRSVDQGAVGPSYVKYSQMAIAYRNMAVSFDQISLTSGNVPIYSGGISEADALTQTQDADRVPSVFSIGMDDNMIPVGPTGPETQGGRFGEASGPE